MEKMKNDLYALKQILYAMILALWQLPEGLKVQAS